MKNVMVQVVNGNRDKVANIYKKFEIVINWLKTYFNRINHAYFTRTEMSHKMQQQTSNNIMSLGIHSPLNREEFCRVLLQ